MATKSEFQFIPLEGLSEPFDLSQLPFNILPEVELADVSDLLPPEMFEHLRVEVGRHLMRVFDGQVVRSSMPSFIDTRISLNGHRTRNRREMPK
jgi:hypothetical protein